MHKEASTDTELRQPAPLPPESVVRPLTNLGRSGFGFDLSRALGAAVQADRLSDTTDAEIRERLIWLRIRHESLTVFGQRIVREAGPILAQADNSPASEADFTLFVGRPEAITLTADLEALIILLRSTLDGIVRLVHAVERDVLHEPGTPRDQVWRLPDVDAAEQALVSRARHAFAHGQAGWPEVVLTPGQPPDLLIAARMRPDYAKGEGYILLSQVENWWHALDQYLYAVERDLTTRITRFSQAP